MAQAHYVVHLPRPSRLVQRIKSRLHPPEIAVDAIREILHLYGLELKGSPRNLTVSKRNPNLVVKTSAGQKVLKRYWNGWPRSVIIHEHSILNRLAIVHFPAPRLAATPDGGTFVSQDSENYALFNFDDGSDYSTNFLMRAHRLRLMAMAGRTMARLHQELEGFMPEGRHHSGFKSYTGDRWRDMAWHIGKVGELKERSLSLTEPKDRVHANWLIQNSHSILEELGRFNEMLGDAPLPRLIIHGDFGLHNLHIHGDGMVTPMDFESARLEWRLRDLVICLARFRYPNGTLDFESIQSFVAAYQAVYPLKAQEWQLLPQVWRFCKLQDAVRYWNSYFETHGPTRKLISARDAVEQADWALKHAPGLTALLETS